MLRQMFTTMRYQSTSCIIKISFAKQNQEFIYTFIYSRLEEASFEAHLPGAAGLTLAKNNVVHDSVFGMLGGGLPIEERGHIKAGIDARMLQLIHEQG